VWWTKRIKPNGVEERLKQGIIHMKISANNMADMHHRSLQMKSHINPPLVTWAIPSWRRTGKSWPFTSPWDFHWRIGFYRLSQRVLASGKSSYFHKLKWVAQLTMRRHGESLCHHLAENSVDVSVRGMLWNYTNETMLQSLSVDNIIWKNILKRAQ